ncbi:DNA-binding protein [Pseudomonas syringae]|uniref:excisionase family protein n=1 Tax=Pseudomonas syringae TaxID=317 RepID=UPI001F3B0462|nr:excisionase family protein [Pseudomonas syringae]MCF5709560.1 DNA-binding protein [Pseudomonas syringae]
MAALQKAEYQLHPGAWFRGEVLQVIFGISSEAARKYRSRGQWLEGKHWRWDPANCIVYNRKAIEAWMEGKP